MSRDVELASYDRDATLFHVADLLRTEAELGRRLEFLRSDYAR